MDQELAHRRVVRPQGAHALRRWGLVAVLAFVLGSGCASLPTSGPVRHSEQLPAQDSEQAPVQVFAEPPRPGDAPLDIVRGFLEAMSSGTSGHDVAREYLTGTRQSQWHPSTTIVYENPSDAGPGAPLAEPQRGRVLLQANKLAEIAPDGAWQPAGEDESLTVHFGVVQVDGEWRIGRPPDALLMSRYDVDREYEQYNRFFFDADFTILVPDPVFLPVRGTRETHLIQSLLRGPSAWLQPAVRTAIPAGTELAAPSVVVEGDLAKIDLDDTVLDLSGGQRQLLSAQIAWTLKEVGVQRIQIMVDQEPLRVDGVGPIQDVDHWATYDPAGARAVTTSYGIAQGRAHVLGPDGPTELAGSLGSGEFDIRSVAGGLFGERVAAVTSNGSEVVVSDLDTEQAQEERPPPSEVVLRGGDFVPPSWDRVGRLWTVDRADGTARIRVVTSEGDIQQVSAPDLAGRDVAAFRVARDGVRVAAVVEEADESRVVVGRIHETDGLAINGVRSLPMPRQVSNADVAWAEIDELVVLGTRADQSQPLLVSVDGSTTAGVGSSALGRVVDSPPAQAVAGAPGAPLLVGSTDNRIWLQHPTYRWVQRGRGHSPAYPG